MTIVAATRAFLIFAWLLLCLSPCWLVYLTRSRRLQGRTQQLLFSVVLAIMNVRVTQRGEVDAARPLLLVTNHMSYLDVLALGATTPVHFTPKAEIAGWPLIGFFCKLAGCVFIDRRRTQTAQNRRQIDEALRQGARLCLFPEGTTSDGTQIMPFRSSFFGVAEQGDLTIQCALVQYDALNSRPIDQGQPNPLAWFGDDEFFPHFWRTLKARRIDASLHFLPAFNEPGERKALAARSEAMILQARQRLLPVAA